MFCLERFANVEGAVADSWLLIVSFFEPHLLKFVHKSGLLGTEIR